MKQDKDFGKTLRELERYFRGVEPDIKMPVGNSKTGRKGGRAKKGKDDLRDDFLGNSL